MTTHPKYTLELTSDPNLPFVIMQHSGDPRFGLSSWKHDAFLTYEDALSVLKSLSVGPILLASSYQTSDNDIVSTGG